MGRENNVTWAAGRKERHIHEKNRRDEREVKKQETQGTRRRQKGRAWGGQQGLPQCRAHAGEASRADARARGGLEMKHLEAPGRKSIWRHPNEKRKSCFGASSAERELGSRFQYGESPTRGHSLQPVGQDFGNRVLQKSCKLPSARESCRDGLSVVPTSGAGGAEKKKHHTVLPEPLRPRFNITAHKTTGNNRRQII